MLRAVSEARERVKRSITVSLVAGLKIASQEDTTVLDFGNYQAARKSEAPPFIECSTVLRDTDRYILVASRNCMTEHPTAGRCVGDWDLLAEQSAYRGRAQRNGPMQHQFRYIAISRRLSYFRSRIVRNANSSANK
jgi:hypothetical protein